MKSNRCKRLIDNRNAEREGDNAARAGHAVCTAVVPSRSALFSRGAPCDRCLSAGGQATAPSAQVQDGADATLRRGGRHRI